MDPLQETAVRKVQGSDNIRTNGSFFVVFTPIDVGPSGAASSIKYVCRLKFIESPKRAG